MTEGQPKLILKRAPIGDNQDDYNVLENGDVVGEAAMAAFAKSWRRE